MKKSETTRAPKSRVIRAVAAFSERRGSRRTAGFDGVRLKPGHRDPRARPGASMHAVQFSRIAATATAAGLIDPISHLRGPRHSGGPHAGASRASLRGRLHRLEVEEVSVSIGFLSAPAGTNPPKRSGEYTAAIPAGQGWRGRRTGSVRPVAARPGGRSAACRRGSRGRRARPRRGRDRGTGSPSRVTPPPAIRRRASLREGTPRASARSAGRCTVPAAIAISGTSSGAWRSRTTRLKWSSARSPGPGAVEAVGDQAAQAALVLAPGARPAAARPAPAAGTTPPAAASGMLIVRPNCSSGGSATPIWLPSDLLIFCSPSSAGEDRHRHHDLGRLAVGGLDLAARA